MKCILAIIVLLLTQQYLRGQAVYQKTELVADLRVLKNILLHTNPSLVDADKDSAAVVFSKLIDHFSLDSASALGLLKYFRDTEYRIQTRYDSHANLSSDKSSLPDKPVYFPVPIYIMDGRMLVNADSTGIPFGSILKKINGVPVADILSALGASRRESNFIRANLGTNFPFVYFAVYGGWHQFELEFDDSAGITHTKVVNSTGLDETIKDLQKSVYPLYRSYSNYFSTNSFEANDSLFYLRLNTFNLLNRSNSGVNYEMFSKQIDSLFININQRLTETLIIDVRGNGGGLLDLPGLIISYLTDEPFTDAQTFLMKPADQIPLDHLRFIDHHSLQSVEEAGKKLSELYRSRVAINDKELLKSMFYSIRKPAGNRYKGKLYLLIDGGTYSAAAYFAALFKGYTKGTIVGTPTGGSSKKVTAGHMLTYELPNTKIRVTVPLMTGSFSTELAGLVPEDFVIPELSYNFENRYKWFIRKKDWDLELLLQKLQNKSSTP